MCPEIYHEICHAEKKSKKKSRSPEICVRRTFLEIGVTKNLGDHETLSIVRHVGLHIDFHP